ncbi:hypothetical protein ABIA30_001800 [Mycobacterium sp. MAA66]|uniref:hypothetical protein n=1 Tax=Mycobacterium sp. MAA66 TaxID=3156297 RepID=UPI0035196482
MSAETPSEATSSGTSPDTPVRARRRLPGFASKLWFRNVVATVVALGSLVLGTVISVFDRDDFTVYWRTRVPAHTIDYAASATIDGQVWTLGRVRQLGRSPNARRPAPRGTAITVVEVNRTGAPQHPVSCDAYLVEGDRRWKAEPAYGGDFWVPPADADGTQDCQARGPLQFSFLLPDDARPSSLDLVDYRGQIGVRLKL